MTEQAHPLLHDYELQETHDTADTTSFDSESTQVDLKDEFLITKPSRWETIRKYAPVVGRYMLAALPRYMQPGGLDCKDKLHATSYLDAVRGYAAFIVMNYHRFDFRGWWFFNLPFINTINSGKGMVDVFFVISGFVLTQRMLKQIHSQQKSKLLESVASSLFRRYIRLFAPCAIATFISMIFVHFKWQQQQAQPLDNIFAQLWDWFLDFCHLANPFSAMTGYWWGGVQSSRYIDPLWTIPVEYRGSIIVYCFVAGTCKLSVRLRLSLCTFIIIACMFWEESYVALFLSGVLLAEISLIRFPERYQSKAPALPHTEPPSHDSVATQPTAPERRKQILTIASRLGYLCAFISAIWLLGMPRNPSKGYWPWPLIVHLQPQSWSSSARPHFFAVIASPILIFSLDSWTALQRPFRWRISQYIGDLSFGIYVLHIIIIRSFYSHVLQPWVRNSWHNSPWGYAFIVIVNWLVVFAAADYFIRVDKRIVRFGRWLQDRCFESW